MCRDASGRRSTKSLVEVDAKCELPNNLFVFILNEEGKSPVEVCLRVEYPWRPIWCTKCSKFGHSIHVCPILAGLIYQEQYMLKENSRGGQDNKDQEDGFTVVQWKVKEKMVDPRGTDQQAKRNGKSAKFQFHSVKKGVIIKDKQCNSSLDNFGSSGGKQGQQLQIT
uniref:Uncharacterized protein n=1 Tax=Daucus carota subsp. sativus TaxID=79200 RepID=A0A161ZP99_DAUCS